MDRIRVSEALDTGSIPVGGGQIGIYTTHGDLRERTIYVPISLYASPS